ncbi:MAG: DUF6345 domain-containing protein [Actinomycetes bacterium]
MGHADPFSPEAVPLPRAGARAAAANDMYGFCSIEDFPPGIGDLSATHDDAQGFYNYVAQFVTPNFWFRDASVLQWIYGETYDNYQDFYGFDSCAVVYHSGHGSMDANGVFWMPMGGDWGGATWASSNDMRLGNEIARYVFLSTCFSLRVLGEMNPRKTWSASNLGFRELFGFETVSIDSPNYGKFFWEEWSKNKSFSQAWLDASWRISTAQAPSAVAVGATQAEAQDRLFNERTFSRAGTSAAWWWWRWYDVARALARPQATLPQTAKTALFSPPDLSAPRLSELAEHYGIQLASLDGIEAAEHGLLLGGGRGEPTMTVDPRGISEVRFADPDGGGRDAPKGDEAVRIASAAIESFALAQDSDLRADLVRTEMTAGTDGEETTTPRTRETTVVYTQIIDGHPIVTPGIGEVRVSIDGAGTVTRVVDATLRIADVTAPPSRSAPPPPAGAETSRMAQPRAAGSAIDDVLEPGVQRLLRRVAAGGHIPSQVRTVPDTTDIGYALHGGEGTLVARCTLEVDCGEGLRKRYVVEEPLGG